MTVTSTEGYGGDIKISVGVYTDGKVSGIAIISISETAGLGMKAMESAFMDQYKDKTVDAFEVTKTGASADNEIDAISGATLTTNGYKQAIERAFAAVNVLKGGAK